MWGLGIGLGGIIIISIIAVVIVTVLKVKKKEHMADKKGDGWQFFLTGEDMDTCYQWVPLQASWDDAVEYCELRNQTLSAMVPDNLVLLLLNSTQELPSGDGFKLSNREKNKMRFFQKNYETMFKGVDHRIIWTSLEDKCYSMIIKEDLQYDVKPAECNQLLPYICEYYKKGGCPKDIENLFRTADEVIKPTTSILLKKLVSATK